MPIGGIMKKFKTYLVAIFIGCIQTVFASQVAHVKPILEAKPAHPTIPPNNNASKECRRLQFLHDGYLHNVKNLHDTYIIPKKLHFIWLEDVLPQRCKQMIQSWKNFHPTWTVKVWRKQDAKKFNFINKKAFDKAKSLEEKSNIWRYEILYQLGGLYVDPRIKCHNSFDEFNQTSEFYAFVENNNPDGKMWNAILGSIPHGAIITSCVFLIKPGNGDCNPERIDQTSGSQYFTGCFMPKALNLYGKVIPLPMDHNYNESALN